MRFPKKTRETLYASEGKPVEIPWPKPAGEPLKGQRYTVQSSHQAGDFRVLVLFTDESEKGWRAIVRIDADPVRLLGKAGGYVTAAAGGMAVRKAPEPNPLGGPQFRSEYEPEAVSSVYLDDLLAEKAEERRSRIASDIAGIEAAIELAEANPDLARDLTFHRNLLRKLKARKLDLTPESERVENAA